MKDRLGKLLAPGQVIVYSDGRLGAIVAVEEGRLIVAPGLNDITSFFDRGKRAHQVYVYRIDRVFVVSGYDISKLHLKEVVKKEYVYA